MWILVAIAMATATGLLDDVRALPPLTRVVLQAAAGGGTARHRGARWSRSVGLGGAGLVLVTVAAVNAVNMLDGQDGLAPGLVAIAGVGLSLLGSGGAAAAAPLAAAGAALGFLPWNHPPARVFLGDAGAYALGVLLAAGSRRGIVVGLAGAPGRRRLPRRVRVRAPLDRGAPRRYTARRRSPEIGITRTTASPPDSGRGRRPPT